MGSSVWSNSLTHLVRQDDSRSSADAHDGNGRLGGNEVQDLRHGLRTDAVFEHHAVDAVGGEGVTDAGEQSPRVGVVDQNRDGVHFQRQVHEVFSAQAPLYFRLVGGAAEHHRHVHGGRRKAERPA